MSPPPSVQEIRASYGEDILVEQTAIALAVSMGWSHANLYAETFGEYGTEGRESEHQVILTRRLRKALEKLNPGLADDAYVQAIDQLAQDRSKQIAVNANRDVYRLLKDGVKVTVPDEHGGRKTETLRVIDWTTPANNDFFLASQMWVAGDMYRRRCDLLGFVNGLPLVFIELKKPTVPLQQRVRRQPARLPRPVDAAALPSQRVHHAVERLGHQGGHADQRVGALLRVEAGERRGGSRQGVAWSE